MKKPAKTPLRLITEISVTPLLDMTLIILVVFILAVPLMRTAPPSAAAAPPPDVAVLKLDERQELLIEGQPVSAERIEDAFRGLKEARPQVAVRIEAARDLPVHRLMSVMDALAAAGIEQTSVETREAAR